MARLKEDKSVMFLMLAGTVFHSRRPATENALSPNLVFLRGMSLSLVVADRKRRWPGSDDIRVVVSDRYCVLVPLLTPNIRTHNLKRRRLAIGSQCSDFMMPVTWARTWKIWYMYMGDMVYGRYDTLEIWYLEDMVHGRYGTLMISYIGDMVHGIYGRLEIGRAHV